MEVCGAACFHLSGFFGRANPWLWALWEKHPHFFFCVSSKLRIINSQTPLLRTFFSFMCSLHFGQENRLIGLMVQFVSCFHTGGHFKAVHSLHRREILVSVHFSSEIKTRILDRFLLVVGFIKAVGEILASAK